VNYLSANSLRASSVLVYAARAPGSTILVVGLVRPVESRLQVSWKFARVQEAAWPAVDYSGYLSTMTVVRTTSIGRSRPSHARRLATLEIGDHGLDALFGQRIEALFEKLPVVGNGVLEPLALVVRTALLIHRRKRGALSHRYLPLKAMPRPQ
jgi:hypothetical protein